MSQLRRWGVGWGLGLGLVGLVAWALWPRPLEVECAVAQRGRLEVSIIQTGVTRVRDRYQVSSPVAGQLLRNPLRSGDLIRGQETLLATIRPSDPSLLDARQVAEIEAQVGAAQLAVSRAEAKQEQARIALGVAENQLARLRELKNSQAVSQEEWETAEANYRSRLNDLQVSSFEREIAKFEAEQAAAALTAVQPTTESPPRDFEILSPIDGAVLRIFQESATVVAAGTPLLEVANPSELEVSIDVLSHEAVQISPGNEIRLTHWGGSEILLAKVRVVEPAAFTKVSALGIEEQRVNVIGDFRTQGGGSEKLGDGYRVEAEILVWVGEDVLQIPNSAMFRWEGNWAVFVVQDRRAQRRTLRVGQRSALATEVLEGLAEGEVVIDYPNDLLDNGTSVTVAAK